MVMDSAAKEGEVRRRGKVRWFPLPREPCTSAAETSDSLTLPPQRQSWAQVTYPAPSQ